MRYTPNKDGMLSGGGRKVYDFDILPRRRTVSANCSRGITALLRTRKRLLYTVCGEQCKN